MTLHYRVILETDAQAVVSRCALRPDELAFGDQSISQVGMSVSGIILATEQFICRVFSFSALPRISLSGPYSSDNSQMCLDEFFGWYVHEYVIAY